MARVRWQAIPKCRRCRIKMRPYGRAHLDCDGSADRSVRCPRCGMEGALYGSWKGC